VKLPRTVPGIIGPITVEQAPSVRDGDPTVLLGKYDSKARHITLDSTACDIVLQHTLWHEWVHSVLIDCGQQLDLKVEEAVCDAVATGLLFTGGILK
jgi:hypothetical protein